jgi:hypothetical protein
MARKRARKKNPKRQMPPALKRYWAARNKRVRRKNPRRRRRNPVSQHVLYAQRKGGPVLKYLGGIKFGRTGVGLRFGSKGEAMKQGNALRRQFKVLRPFKLWAS